MKKWIPTLPEIVREGLIVIGGAVLAAFAIGQFPSVRAWIKEQWKE